MATESVADLQLLVTQNDIDMLLNVVSIAVICLLMFAWIFTFYRLYISGIWKKSSYSTQLRREYWESFTQTKKTKRKKQS